MSFLVNLIKNKVARFSTDASGNTALEGADGSIAFNAAELRGASPSATAAVNTAAIQAALDLAGYVTITLPGTYLVNQDFVIKSDTHFYIGAGVVLKQAPSNNKKFAKNTNYASASIIASGNIAVSNIVGSNRHDVATVPLTNPATFAVGSYIQITGDTTDSFNGIQKVYAVNVASNNVQFLLSGKNHWTASSGTIKVAPADANITIECPGLIDYDEPHNADGSNSLESMGFVFNRIGNLRVPMININNVNKYCFCIGNSYNTAISDMYAVTGSDGVHLNGPNHNVVVRNIRGTYGDDVVAWTGSDAGYTIYALEDGQGPLDGLLIDGVYADATTARGVLIAPSSVNTSTGSNITIRNLHIPNVYARGVQIDSPVGESGVVNDIVIDGISVGALGANLPNYVTIGPTGATSAVTVKSLTIKNARNPASGYLPTDMVWVNWSSVVNRIVIEGGSVTLDTEGAASRYLVTLANSARVDSCDFIGVETLGVGTTRAYGWIGSMSNNVTATDVNVIGGSLSGKGAVTEWQSTVPTTVRIDGLKFAGFVLVGGSTGFTAHVRGVNVVSASANLIYNLYGTSKTYNLYLYGNMCALTTQFGYGTTNTINIKGSDATTKFKSDTAGHTFNISTGVVIYDTQTAAPGVYVKGPTAYTLLSA